MSVVLTFATRTIAGASGDGTPKHVGDVSAIVEYRHKFGTRERKEYSFINVEVPNNVAKKIGRFMDAGYMADAKFSDDKAFEPDSIFGLIMPRIALKTHNRRIHIPVQKLQNKATSIGVLISWSRFADQKDDYQPFEDKIVPLSIWTDTFRDKVKDIMINHEDDF